MRRPILALFVAPTILAAVQAVAAVSTPAHMHRPTGSEACEAQRLASWFEVQRQLTDGDVEPAKPNVSRDECMPSGSRAGPMAERVETRDAPTSATSLADRQGPA